MNDKEVALAWEIGEKYQLGCGACDSDTRNCSHVWAAMHEYYLRHQETERHD